MKTALSVWQQQLDRWVRAACLMEVLSPKPGNVSPGSEFADASIRDFLLSADAIGPPMSLSGRHSIGETILQSVKATRSVVSHNTNLGIILLLAPLAAVPPEKSLWEGISQVLSATTVEDSIHVYRAIRVAQPAGLGEVADQDLNDEPTMNLVECMRLAADRDLIALQYSNGFHQVLDCGLGWLRDAAAITSCQKSQIVFVAIRLLAEFGDSLIARKCGVEMSDLVRKKALNVLESGWPSREEASNAFVEFDSFLRADGHRRNPGTTADMVAAILFSALREGWIIPGETWMAPSIRQA